LLSKAAQAAVGKTNPRDKIRGPGPRRVWGGGGYGTGGRKGNSTKPRIAVENTLSVGKNNHPHRTGLDLLIGGRKDGIGRGVPRKKVGKPPGGQGRPTSPSRWRSGEISGSLGIEGPNSSLPFRPAQARPGQSNQRGPWHGLGHDGVRGRGKPPERGLRPPAQKSRGTGPLQGATSEWAVRICIFRTNRPAFFSGRDSNSDRGGGDTAQIGISGPIEGAQGWWGNVIFFGGGDRNSSGADRAQRAG